MAAKSILGALFGRDYERSADLCFQRGQLEKAAELYRKGGHFHQAAKIYDQLGRTAKAIAVYADAGMNLEAGELLVAKGEHKDAIALFEAAGAYRQAAESCVQAQQPLRAGRLFEQAGIHDRAAECFASAGEMERALRAWERQSTELKTKSNASDRQQAAEIRRLDMHRVDLLSKFGRHGEAGELLREWGLAKRAGLAFERAGRFSEAAATLLEAGEAEASLHAAERAQDMEPELHARILRRTGRYQDAGELLLAAGDLPEAAEAFEAAESWAKAAAIWERAEALDRAADLYLRLDRFRDAARCLAMAGQHEGAAEAFAKAGDHEEAGNAYQAAAESLGNSQFFLKAAQRYLKAGVRPSARGALESIGPHSGDYARACVLLIPLLLHAGDNTLAAERLAAAEDSDSIDSVPRIERIYWRARIADRQEDWERARELLEKAAKIQPGFRDVDRRLKAVERQLDETRTGSVRDTLEIPAVSADELMAQAVELIAGDKPPAPPAVQAPAVPESPPLSATDSLPFELGDSQPPWWPGIDVAKALDQRSHKQVHLLSFPLSELPPAQRDTFRREMSRIGALQLPTILKLEETVITESRVLLLFEPFAGKPLGRVLATRKLSPVAALNLLVQLSDGLSAAHKMGVSHNWLSPNTILVNSATRGKLVGFGLGQLFAERDPTGQAYLAPESRDQAPAGPASDMFSLGLLGAELLRAQLPAAWSKKERLDPKTVGWPPQVEELAPAPLREVLVQCLARDPMRRPSAEQLKAELSSVGLVPGQVLADRYEILGELGRGGMSRVYRACDRELDEEVAIKTVLSPAFGRSSDEDRLLREVQICRKLSHPNVVRVHDFGRFPGGIFVIMELLNGPGLDHVIKDEAPLPLGRIKSLLMEIAAALGEAHRLEVVHRDLKPGNVILHHGRVKVMDFGIARMGDSPSHLTRTGQVVGSPMYMSPEQIQGLKLDGASDLYALGVIAYTLTAGREPFLGDSTTAVVLKHLHEEPPDIRGFRPELPKPWVEMLARLLAKKPEDRFASAEQLTRALSHLPE